MKRYLEYSTGVKLIVTVFLLILSFFLAVFKYPDDFVASSNILTCLAILVYLWIILSAPAKVENKINLYRIFILLTIPFYFGGQILILSGYATELGAERYSLIDGRLSLESSIRAMQFIISSLLCVHIGYLSSDPTHDKGIRTNKVSINENVMKGIDLVASLLIIVTIGPSIARLVYDIATSRTLGHLAAFNMRSEEDYLGIWFIFTYIQGWFLPACYMKLIAGKTRLPVYILLGVYCVLYLMSGSRFQILLILFCVFLIEIYWNERRINKRSIIKLLLFGWLMLVILRSVSYTRDTTGSGLSWDSIKDVIGGGVLYEGLFETSTTFTSIVSIIERCPSYLPFNCGKSVVGSLIYVLPSFLRPSWFGKIVLHISAVLSPLYYGFKGAGYGSAFLAEAYFNYGYFSYIVLILFGIILGWLIRKIVHSASEKDAYSFIVSMYIMSELVWGIRADLYLVPRHVVYYVLIPLIIAKLISRRYHD